MDKRVLSRVWISVLTAVFLLTPLSNRVQAASQNLAGGAAVLGVASTVDTAPSEHASNLFDGSTATKWYCSSALNWVVFDIGALSEVHRLRVVHAGGADTPEFEFLNTADFSLQILNTSRITEEAFLSADPSEKARIMQDPAYWQSVKSYTDNYANVTDDTLALSSPRRIFRLYVTKGYHESVFDWMTSTQIYELALYGTPIDRSALSTTIDEAASLQKDNYTPNSWSAFATALSEANAVLNDTSSMQAQIDAAQSDLTDAQNALQKRADTKALTSLLKEAESRKEADYTAASWAAFSKAKRHAEMITADENAAQSEVDQAESALKQALAALQKKPESSVESSAESSKESSVVSKPESSIAEGSGESSAESEVTSEESPESSTEESRREEAPESSRGKAPESSAVAEESELSSEEAAESAGSAESSKEESRTESSAVEDAVEDAEPTDLTIWFALLGMVLFIIGVGCGFFWNKLKR